MDGVLSSDLNSSALRGGRCTHCHGCSSSRRVEGPQVGERDVGGSKRHSNVPD